MVKRIQTITKKCGGDDIYPVAGCNKEFTTTDENMNLCFECWSKEMDCEFGKDEKVSFDWFVIGTTAFLIGFTILLFGFL
jgi:hypothetical protein